MKPIFPLPSAPSTSPTTVTPLTRQRLARAKFAYTTRHLPNDLVAGMIDAVPRAGDLVLARVDHIGHHTRLELPSGRRAHLHPGDEVVVAMGNRYAPDQFEGLVPGDLGPCQLGAAGGIAARVECKHQRAKNATRIQPLGLLVDAAGTHLNLDRFAVAITAPTPRPLTLAVAGTSMNAGKTTTVAHLVRGLTRSGLRVGAAKITGTGSGGDAWTMLDAGAEIVVDFTDAGHASTYLLESQELERIAERLTGHLAAQGCEVVVIEIADGLYQRETAVLLQSRSFRSRVDGMLFAGSDAMGTVAGVSWLHQHGWPMLGASGKLTTSPLAVRETGQALDIPILDIETLGNPEIHRLMTDLVHAAHPVSAVA